MIYISYYDKNDNINKTRSYEFRSNPEIRFMSYGFYICGYVLDEKIKDANYFKLKSIELNTRKKRVK